MTTARHSDRRPAGRRACVAGVSPARAVGVPPTKSTAGAAVLQRGFSLAELVLALGILAVGLTMAAALFPAAIKLNELSTHDSIGTIVATNGLAIARSVVRSDEVGSTALQSVEGAAAFGTDPWLLKYPAVDPATVSPPQPTTRGYIPLARRIENPPGVILGYQLVIVAYDKYTPGMPVQAKTVQITSVTGAVATLAAGQSAAVGSPLIVKMNGSYAKIIEFNPSTREATLDHAIDVGPSPPPPDVDAFVIEDDGAPGRNCVMMVLVAETLLKPTP